MSGDPVAGRPSTSAPSRRTTLVSFVGVSLVIGGTLAALAGLLGIAIYVFMGNECRGAASDCDPLGTGLVMLASVALALLLPIGGLLIWLGRGVFRRNAGSYVATVVLSIGLSVLSMFYAVGPNGEYLPFAVALSLPGVLLMLPRAREDLAANRNMDDRALYY